MVSGTIWQELALANEECCLICLKIFRASYYSLLFHASHFPIIQPNMNISQSKCIISFSLEIFSNVMSEENGLLA